MVQVGVFDPRALTLPPDLQQQYLEIVIKEADLVEVFTGQNPLEKRQKSRRHVVLATSPINVARATAVLAEIEDLKASFTEGAKAFEIATRDDETRIVGDFPTIADQSMSAPFFVTRAGRVSMTSADFAATYAAASADPALKVTTTVRSAWRVGTYTVAEIQEDYDRRIARKIDAIENARQRHQHERVRVRQIHLQELAAEMREIRDAVAAIEASGRGPVALWISSGEGHSFHAAWPVLGDLPRIGRAFAAPNVALVCAMPGVELVPAHRRQREGSRELVAQIGRVGIFVSRPQLAHA